MSKIISCFSLLILSMVLLFSCSHHVTSQSTSQGISSPGQNVASPPCIIYKTRSDYSRQVPVILNEKQTSLSSYPEVRDIIVNGNMTYPTKLTDGFLLDNRGIGPHVAFLDYTYEDYGKLGQTPSADQLMMHLLDKDPITEMYQCKTRIQYKDIENDLNKMITSGNLNSCKKIK